MRDAIRAARRLAGRLPLPDPWSVEDLCTQVADSRQRPIVLIERAAQGDSITAMVIGTQTTDYIFCREDLKGLHRDHAICHELGHLLAGHTEQVDLVATFRLAPSTITTLSLNRDYQYGERREQEAEAVADAIVQRVSKRISRQDDLHLNRIIHGFGDALR
jgi:hypothetical protein